MTSSMFDDEPMMAPPSRSAPPMATQRPMSRAHTPTKPKQFTLDRTFLRSKKHIYIRVVVGFLIAIAWLSSISFSYGLFNAVYPENITAGIVGIIVGILVSAFLSFGQFFFSEGPPIAYFWFLLPDVTITFWQLQKAVFHVIVRYNDMNNGDDLFTIDHIDKPVYYAILAALFVFSVIASWGPERILFGAREKMKGNSYE